MEETGRRPQRHKLYACSHANQKYSRALSRVSALLSQGIFGSFKSLIERKVDEVCDFLDA